MKKKFKLFATIGSLCLAVAMMTIGVLAATTASFTVTSNVTFSAVAGIYATYTVTDGTDTKTSKNWTSLEAASTDFADKEVTLNTTANTVTESNPTYSYTIEIVNNGLADADGHEGFTATHDGEDVTSGAHTVSYVWSGVAAGQISEKTVTINEGETATLTVTYTQVNFSTSDSADLGCTITLNIA